MGVPFVEVIEDDGSGFKYICTCGRDVASDQALVWEGYMASNKQAILFKQSVNLGPCGPRREEHLSTGRYILVDVMCRCCTKKLGWMYLCAENPDQKYKEKCTLLSKEGLRRVNRVTGAVAVPPIVR